MIRERTESSPKTTPTVLDVDSLRKSYGDVVAVTETSFSLRSGQFLTLLGPSGCGKTTTLRLIAGFEPPDAGSIDIHGRNVAGPGVFVPPEQRRIGMVFQDYALFPHLNVADNIGFGVRGDRRARSQRVAEMLSLVGLEGYGDRMPSALSGGQQQRVALARALAPQPNLLLLDEPFSNLDAALRAQVRADLRAILRQAGESVVFVTHDQEEALSLSDFIAVMFEGTVEQIAPPLALYTRPASRRVAEFVGEAYWLPIDAEGTTGTSPMGDVTLVEAKRGPIDGLIRPEQLVVGEGGVMARVEWREFYGHDQRVGLRLADGRVMAARTPPHIPITPGDTVTVKLRGPLLPFDRV
ncbi:MAG: ABC transporter ATP-binding protein [Chloroflexi bacterium]|nr:ABC transporter ATP-binding protein [Chloroflexota bacterium]